MCESVCVHVLAQHCTVWACLLVAWHLPGCVIRYFARLRVGVWCMCRLYCALYNAACTLCEGACLAALPRVETLPSNSEPLRVLGATKGSESK